ncbi:MAG: substrate-binding domain-containing protein [Pseudomonadota bacterium]
MSANQQKLLTSERRARTTINDVAAALNLTKSTVSRAMNGYADISKSTQNRVMKMAETMNYQPLSHAQAIKTGLNRSLGLVLQLSDHDAHRPFLAEFLAGVSAGASTEGYTLTLASADTHDSLIASFRTLKQDGKADGFILPRAMVSDPRVAFLRKNDVPFVLYGRPPDARNCSWFDIRGEDAMRTAVQHLADLGHRRIGFINGGNIYAYAGLRRQGFLLGMQAAGLRVDPSLLLEDAVTQEDGFQASRRLLDHANPPTAIVCAIDQVALGTYRAARTLELRIGIDLSVTGYDGIQAGAQAQPPLTTFSVDNKAAGARLATLLIQQIRGVAPAELRETVAATFQRGGSTGPAPGKNDHLSNVETGGRQ